jgi:hypothetical protein
LKEKSDRFKAAASEDNEAFQAEKKLYRRPQLDFHGNPYCAGSKIRYRLIADVLVQQYPRAGAPAAAPAALTTPLQEVPPLAQASSPLAPPRQASPNHTLRKRKQTTPPDEEEASKTRAKKPKKPSP